MEKKTITRDEYQEATRKISKKYNQYCHSEDARVASYVQAAMDAFSLIVEPEPILSGATEGDWEFKLNMGGSIYAGDEQIGHVYGANYGIRSSNGKVMAGSKKLVVVCVAMLRSLTLHPAAFCKETVAVIDQLEEMGVPVDEFREDTQ